MSNLLKAGKRKLLLLARLLQEELGRLPCPLLRYTVSEGIYSRILSKEQASHKVVHKTNGNPLRNLFPPKVVSEPDPASGHFNPFPTFSFTGSLRPVYPLSPRRAVPPHIKRPDYSEDGDPKSERRLRGRHNITILNEKEIEAMRKVCRLGREVLDLAAKEVRPGITTDYLDEIVHNACIERDVRCKLGSGPKPVLTEYTTGIPFTSELCAFSEVTLHFRQ